MIPNSDKTKTYAFSLYPDDAAIIESVAAEQFRHNTSEAARHIIRHYRECQNPPTNFEPLTVSVPQPGAPA